MSESSNCVYPNNHASCCQSKTSAVCESATSVAQGVQNTQSATTAPAHHLSHHHHMRIRWHEFFTSSNDTPVQEARFPERAVLVGHIGMMLLSCGTGAWRVRDAMNTIARNLNMTCSADIGLVSLDYTCIDCEGRSYTQALSLPSTGVNTSKLNRMEAFVRDFDKDHGQWSVGQVHQALDSIEAMKVRYKPYQVALAAGLACAGFIFLLGGGIYEVLCCFFGAAAGNYVRRKMLDRKITLVADIAVAVAVACVVYLLSYTVLFECLRANPRHLDGYIGALLFVIPGFPFITSGLDLSKLDMRSGIERAVYALMIIAVAVSVGWSVALCLDLRPQDFLPILGLTPLTLTLLRLLASWCGVFGFSIMFNTEPKMAALAGVLGAIANTLRLSLVSWTPLAPCIAAFFGTLTAGLLASIVRKKIGYPRIALTVPSIVIMVPGLYMYRAMYNFGALSLDKGSMWLLRTILIVFCLPLGLIVARILTDPKWRHAG